MDEKGCMLGVIGKLRVIVSRAERKPYMTQCGNREWVSLIECVSVSGRVLSPWVIFKGKVHQKAWRNRLNSGHIALSENGWTDDELGLEWLEKTFHPETEAIRKGEYRILIFDGHGSHLTTSAIRFCISKKIILLCLPPHSTHILQPLDVGVFAPLAIAYTNGVHSRTRFGASYSIDKVDFLEIYQEARDKAISVGNVLSAWEKTGLSPLNPDIVLHQFRPPSCSNEALLTSSSRPITPGDTGPIDVDTPINITDVQGFLRQVQLCTLTARSKEKVEKIGKACMVSMANSITLKATNIDLIEASKAKEKRKNRDRGNDGKARVLDMNEVNRRIWEAVCKEFNHLGPDIFKEPPIRSSPRKPTIAAQNRAFQAAIKPLLRLDPSIFQSKSILQPPKTTTQDTPLNSRQRKLKIRAGVDTIARSKRGAGSHAARTTTAKITTQLSSYGRLIRKKLLD
jgi:hypothetical protein